MPARASHPTRRRRPRRPPTTKARGEHDVDLVVSIVRLGVGAWSLGVEELAKRLAATGQAAPSKTAARAKNRRRKPSAAVAFGWVTAGAAVESAEYASRWLRSAAAGGRRSRAAMRSIRRMPGAALAGAVLSAPVTAYQARIAELRERGREETNSGRRMVSHLVRDTTKESVHDIAESAVREVAHSPEVAALVRTQSASLATGTILEVRTKSEEADDDLERRVRSWLHRPQRTGDGAPGEPSPPGPPAA